MEGPAFDNFFELEAAVKNLFRSARLWHQVGYRGADGRLQTPIWSIEEVPVGTAGSDPYRLVGINVHGGTEFETFKMIVDAGANVVLTTKGIDDMALKYFVEAGVIACRRVPKDDMRRIAKCTGAKMVTSLADMEGEESFDPRYKWFLFSHATALGERESVSCSS
jgi:hypothetical protein